MRPSLHLQEIELAEMILAGARRRPLQSFGEYFTGRDSSCALGAAYEGLYRLPADAGGIRPRRLDLLFDCLDSEIRACPECGKKSLALGSLIVHLNDRHRWDRERIAEWLKADAAAR
jgi:hypothetical protein